MSKTIIIQKNGVAQTLTVDKLRLPKYGGGTEDWLPADGKNLVKIVVKQNGTYKASDFGAYGISEVKVACTLSGGSATSAAVEKTIKTLRNPCPAEGGLARNMSAHHLETLLSTTGSCQWVPEAEVSLGTKYINVDNRTYKAKDDGKYGWSQVTVSGISITQDGNTITHTDGEGTTTYTLPDHIEVVQPPHFTIYTDGHDIDFTGMIVKAYNENGSLWTDTDHPNGVIPFEELILPVTKADKNAIEDAVWVKVLNGREVEVCKIFHIYQYWNGQLNRDATNQCPPEAVFCYTDDGCYACSDIQDYAISYAYSNDGLHKYDSDRGKQGFRTLFRVTSSPSVITGESMYYRKIEGGDWVDNGGNPWSLTNEPQLTYSGFDKTTTFDIALHGDGAPTGGQPIPVQWRRPWDGELLETRFYITIAPGYGGENDGTEGVPLVD